MSQSASADEAKAVRERTTPPARDTKIAVQEEYEIARQRGTAQALELFISRQPDDPLIRGQNTKTIANLVIEPTAF